MKDLGEANVILDINTLLRKFNSFDVLPARTPYDSNILTILTTTIALLCLLKNLKGTINWSLHFANFPIVIERFCNANWISDNDEISSTSGYMYTLGRWCYLL
ncbi:hypothetical protein CR513_57379, partial [Mucuna pruriens]